MRATRLAALLGLVLGLAACVPVVSLNPLYTDKDIVFDPALVGTWSDKDGEGFLTFSKRNDASYDVLMTDDDRKEARFVGHLVKLGARRFLDLASDRAALDDHLEDVSMTTLTAPGHFFLTVKQIEPTLQMGFLDDEWMEKLIKSNAAAMRGLAARQVTESGDRAVLIGSTEDLQRFVVANVDKPGAFNSTSELRRQP